MSFPLSGQVLLGSGKAGDLERVNWRVCLQVGKKVAGGGGGVLPNSQTGPEGDALWKAVFLFYLFQKDELSRKPGSCS